MSIIPPTAVDTTLDLKPMTRRPIAPHEGSGPGAIGDGRISSPVFDPGYGAFSEQAAYHLPSEFGAIDLGAGDQGPRHSKPRKLT